jgi:hypothetical protein
MPFEVSLPAPDPAELGESTLSRITPSLLSPETTSCEPPRVTLDPKACSARPSIDRWTK